MAFDFKKEYKEFYMPKNKPGIVTVPSMNYIAVRGQGDPNEEGGEYKQSIGLLYGIAFTVKMSKMGEHRIDGYFDYVVPPLEGFWWQDGAAGIDYAQTTVGDRYVWENMVETGNCLGGEQSGHIIMSKYATTGDGILTAIKVMEAVISSKLPLSKLAEPVKMLPQVLKNVRVADKAAVRENAAVRAALKTASDALNGNGRVLLRESGTEPVVRVMAEAETEALCERVVESVVGAIRSEGLENG